MKFIPVSELPKRNAKHKLQDLITEFLAGPDDVVLVDFKENDYKAANVCYSCLHAAAKRSRSCVKVHIRGNCVYLSKN